METIGQRLRKLRKAKKLSTKKCSEKIGISTGAISEIENGVNPKIDTVNKIVTGLGLNAKEKHYLVFGEEFQEEEKHVTNFEILQKINALEKKINVIEQTVTEERREQAEPQEEYTDTGQQGVVKPGILNKKSSPTGSP